MMNEFEFEDGGEMESAKLKTSRYQVIPAERLARFERPRLALRYERSKMKDPVYYRLKLGESFAGVKRLVTEYLPAGAARWQLDSFPHDESETQKLSKPPMGIATLPREKISSIEQRRVTHPKSKDQVESDKFRPGLGRVVAKKPESERDTVDLPPVPSGDGLTD